MGVVLDVGAMVSHFLLTLCYGISLRKEDKGGSWGNSGERETRRGGDRKGEREMEKWSGGDFCVSVLLRDRETERAHCQSVVSPWFRRAVI